MKLYRPCINFYTKSFSASTNMVFVCLWKWMVEYYTAPRFIHLTGSINRWKVRKCNVILHILRMILRKIPNVCLRLSFLSKNSLTTSAKFMLFRIFLWTCTNIRACNRLFPILDSKYVFMHFKTERGALTAFVACESKSNLIILPTSLSKKRLFRDICCNLLIMVLMSIASLSLKVH